MVVDSLRELLVQNPHHWRRTPGGRYNRLHGIMNLHVESILFKEQKIRFSRGTVPIVGQGDSQERSGLLHSSTPLSGVSPAPYTPGGVQTPLEITQSERIR